MAEKELITPLDAEEIKIALSVMIGERTVEELSKNCDFHQCAYPKFKAHIRIEGELDKFGQLIPFKCEFEIPHTPPNLLRKQTGQPIPVLAEKADGSTEQKNVFYKRERESRYLDD